MVGACHGSALAMVGRLRWSAACGGRRLRWWTLRWSTLAMVGACDGRPLAMVDARGGRQPLAMVGACDEEAQVLVTMFVFYVGQVFYFTMFGSMMNVMSSMDAGESDFKTKVDRYQAYMRKLKVSARATCTGGKQ
ncbi:hypothetical protein CYMTET_34922 [Cymbomonas tetramitiformis]|uniref:Uncharacterized protein n=1 Tax=Cymbomonas tetramitiformis TaxID=36881 RepID=A0AAE0KPP6_9CHLO|nr:hypothetical protein CYMTET_34922 [Cymbomonas tetramitiformis]